MSEKYKLGLTRNRLFEFNNCVLHCGKISDALSEADFDGALEKLSLAEPIITADIDLQADGEAYAVSGAVTQRVLKCEKTKDDIFSEYEKNGMDFSEKLFEFKLSSDGWFIIAGHTAVADAKSLLHLAREFALFCRNKYAYVEKGEISLLPETGKLPLEVVSPILDKLSANLEDKWSDATESYTLDDYRRAKEAFVAQKAAEGELYARLDGSLTDKLKVYAEKEGLDASSVVAYAFYIKLLEALGGKEKDNKMNIYTDRRFFFHDYENYFVGANNGTVTVSLNKKERTKSLQEQVKKFHFECYKSSTSVFRSFYDDFLLMKLSPSFCDSSYMYAAGLTKNKASKRLAENYGCCCKKLCDYFFCNLDQTFWEELSAYGELTVKEPLKMRAPVYVGCTLKSGECGIVFRYNKGKCDDEKAKEILENSIKEIEKIITE